MTSTSDQWEIRYSQSLAATNLVQTQTALLQPVILERWLQECDEKHDCHGSHSTWPTRLIDIGVPRSRELRLRETDLETDIKDDDSGYVALSHCWGGPSTEDKKQFCTTNENYQHRISGFNLGELPKTFQDAVRVVRSVGVRFLWIDAICIIQSDSPTGGSDWQKEAGRMEEVFNGAYFTIAVAAARTWRDGFLSTDSPRQTMQPLDIPSAWQPVDDKDNEYKRDVDGGPLHQRAWVLQERVLSRRIIHFTRGHVYWECGQSIRRDDALELRCGRGKHYFLHDPDFPQRLYEAGFFRSADFVQRLFEQYAQSGITKKTDKDVAISSLIRRMVTVWGTECRYGVFTTSFSRLLIWKRRDDGCEHAYTGPHVPSWSWMSHSDAEFPDLGMIRVPSLAELRFDPQQPNALLVRVRMLRAFLSRRDGRLADIVDTHQRHVGSCWFDSEYGTVPQPLCCIVLAADASPRRRKALDSDVVYHVSLVRARADLGGYQRIGLAHIRARYVSLRWHKGRLL